MTRFYDERGDEVPRISMLIELGEPDAPVTYTSTSPITEDSPVRKAARAVEEMRRRQREAS